MLTLRHDDQDQRVARHRQDQSAGEQRYETNDRGAPEPGQPFANFRPQMDRLRVPLFLKLLLDKEE